MVQLFWAILGGNLHIAVMVLPVSNCFFFVLNLFSGPQGIHKGSKFFAGSGGTPSKSKSEFRVGWGSTDDYYCDYLDHRYRSCFLRCMFFCAVVFFALQFVLRHQVIQKGIKFLAGSAGTPSKSKSECRVGCPPEMTGCCPSSWR